MNILKTIFSFIGRVIMGFWAYFRRFQSAVGTLLFFALVMFIAITFFKAEKVTVPEQAAIVVSLDGVVQEQKIYNQSPLQTVTGGQVSRQTILRDVIKSIDRAAEDDRIKMMIINTNGLRGAGPSKLHYIGAAMTRFKEAGKKIVTYGNSFSQGSYLIASYANEVYLNPYGSVLLYGYGSYQNYYKGFLDKIKAEIQLFRVGKYKSAMEPFIRSDMSPAAKEASLELMGGLWAEYSKDVSASRGLDYNDFLARFNSIEADIASVKGDLSALALKHKLVDGLKTREEWRTYLADQMATSIKALEEKVIGHRAYLMATANGLPSDKDMIAVVYANGTIMDGEQPQGIAGGDTIARHLREARLNGKVKAVVLRVDSPGGSAFASEIIRQEVLQLKATGKPVIVSMGSLAASGGYWVSANANEIWASPTTITGSIGIFGAVPNLEGTLATIGITTDGVGTTPLSGAAVTKPLPDTVKAVIQGTIENGYDRFLNLVAEGRNMTVEQVNDIAQGRVWTGQKAHEIGLVDKLGTFDDAVAAAAEKAGLTDYKLAYWEDPIPWEVKFVSEFMERNAGISAMFMSKTPSPQEILAARIMEELSLFTQMNDPNHAYVLCVTCMADFGGK